MTVQDKNFSENPRDMIIFDKNPRNSGLDGTNFDKNPRDFFRDMISPHIADGAFLRRDRGDALYITNSPARGKNVEIIGFSVESDGKIARIRISPDCLENFARQMELSEDMLSKELSRFMGGSEDSAALFAEIMKAMENPPGADIYALEKRLRQTAAAALRKGGGEGLYWCARALATLKDIK